MDKITKQADPNGTSWKIRSGKEPGSLRTILISLASLTVASVPAIAKESPAPTHRHHIPTTSVSRTALSTFNNGHISFRYPSRWQKKEKDGKEVIVKLEGETADKLNGSITLSKHENPETSAQDLKNAVDGYYLKKLDQYKKQTDKPIYFGPTRKREGHMEDITFSVNGMNVYQRIVFFDSPAGAYTITFISPVSHFKKLEPVYNNVLMSFTMAGPATLLSGSGSSTKSASHLITYKSSMTPLVFDYPDGWSIKEGVHGDHPVQITGKDAGGHLAELSVFQGDANRNFPGGPTLEQLANMIEQEHYAKVPKYRRVRRSSRQFGSGARISGIIQENQFEHKGVPVKQMAAFFEHGNKVYSLSLISFGWKESDMHHIFHKVLATLRLQ